MAIFAWRVEDLDITRRISPAGKGLPEDLAALINRDSDASSSGVGSTGSDSSSIES